MTIFPSIFARRGEAMAQDSRSCFFVERQVKYSEHTQMDGHASGVTIGLHTFPKLCYVHWASAASSNFAALHRPGSFAQDRGRCIHSIGHSDALAISQDFGKYPANASK